MGKNHKTDVGNPSRNWTANVPWLRRAHKAIEDHPAYKWAGIIITFAAVAALPLDAYSWIQSFWNSDSVRNIEKKAAVEGSIRTVLIDGTVLHLTPSAQIRILPEDVVTLYRHLGEQEKAEEFFMAAMKRQVLRVASGYSLEDLLAHRPTIEDQITQALVQDMKPLGLTILNVSLGEIR